MFPGERDPLLTSFSNQFEEPAKQLSVFFAVICVVDVFGVFPIIALPKAIIQCGWLGLPLVIIVFSLQIYTAILLGKCWVIAEKIDRNIVAKNRYPYAAIAEMTYGKYMAMFVTVLLDITVFGGGIPNLLVAAQNLQLFGLRMTDNQFEFSFCFWMLIIGILLCPFLWLGSPKDMKILCSVSAVTVLSVSILTWTCIIKDGSSNIPPPVNFDNTPIENMISAYGIVAFQFDIHPMLLTIHVDMKEKSKIPRVVILGFLITACLFTLTTLLAAYKYGLNTHSNVLQGLPPSIPLYITVLLVTLQLCMTSAVSNSALYQNVEDYLKVPRDFNYRRCLIRSSLTALAIFVAESVPRFDLVMSLIGGTLTGPLVFIFPSLFYIKMIKLKNMYASNVSLQNANHFMYHADSEEIFADPCDTCVNNKRIIAETNVYNDDEGSKFQLCLSGLIILIGVLATCITTYSNVLDTIKHTTFSPPCLYNLTAATFASRN